MVIWNFPILLLSSTCLSIVDAASLTSLRPIGNHIAAGIGLNHGRNTYSTTYNGGNALGSGSGSMSLQATGESPAIWPSAGRADQCWAEWQKLWLSDSVNTGSNLGWSKTFTVTKVEKVTHTSLSWTMSTKAETYTVTVENGGFPLSTYTTTDLEENETTLPNAKASTWTDTYTITEEETKVYKNRSMVTTAKPSCQLPTPYYKCQSQWLTWASRAVAPYPQPWSNCTTNALWVGNPLQGLSANSQPPCYTAYTSVLDDWTTEALSAKTPHCRAASVTGAMCASLKDAYVDGHNSALFTTLLPTDLDPIYVTFSEGYYQTPNSMASWGPWIWPTSNVIAPGCTLGCGRCALTGGSIQLLYFPPGLTHPATVPVTAITLGTTLTSPTYYISFSRVYGANACGPVGPNISSTIVPVPTDATLSSVWGSPYLWGEEQAQARTSVELYTAPFNITDLLQKPVPYSVYSSQPWCATFRFQPNSTTHCPTTAAYKPILVVPDEVLQSINPAFAQCSIDLRGLYDPPHALQPATAIAGPSLTAPNNSPTQPATPASSLQNPPVATTTAPTEITTTGGPATAHASDLPASQNNDPNTDDPDTSSPISSRRPGTAKSYPISAPTSPKLTDTHGSTDSSGDPASLSQGGIASKMASLLGAVGTSIESANADPSGTKERSNDPASPADPPATSSVNAVISILSAAEHSLSVSLYPNSRASATRPDLSISRSGPASLQPPSVTPAGSATSRLDGHHFTAIRSGDSVILHNGASTVTVHFGSQTDFGGQTVSVGAGGSGVVVNGKTIAASSVGASLPSEALFTADGQTFTVIDQSGSAVIEDASSIATVKYASTISFNGQSISVEASGAAVMVSGETIKMSAETPARSISNAASNTSHGPVSRTESDPSSSVTSPASPNPTLRKGTGAIAKTMPFNALAAPLLALIIIPLL